MIKKRKNGRSVRDWVTLGIAILTLMSMLGVGIKIMTPGSKAVMALEEKHDDDINKVNDRIDEQQKQVLTPIYGIYRELKKMNGVEDEE